MSLLLALFLQARIVLVAGSVTPVDAPGHHDDPGGCTHLAELLQQGKRFVRRIPH